MHFLRSRSDAIRLKNVSITANTKLGQRFVIVARSRRKGIMPCIVARASTHTHGAAYEKVGNRLPHSTMMPVPSSWERSSSKDKVLAHLERSNPCRSDLFLSHFLLLSKWAESSAADGFGLDFDVRKGRGESN